MNATERDPAEVLLCRQKGAAEGRVAAALVTIEEAERLLDRASRALSGVRGLTSEWRRVGQLQKAAKRHRETVKSRSERLRGRGHLRIEHMPDLAEMEWDVVRRGQA